MNLHDNNYNYVQNYFNNLRNSGYNVGLGIKPNNNSGAVSYNQLSVGLLLQPSVNYYLSDMVALTTRLSVKSCCLKAKTLSPSVFASFITKTWSLL